MARSTATVTRASEIGGALGPNGRIDTHALTDRARVHRIQIPVPGFTINSTVSGYSGPLGIRGIIKAIWLSALTAPVGGTLAVDVNLVVAGTATKIATADPEALTSKVGAAMTMQAANDTLVAEAADVFRVDAVASNATVSTDIASGYVTILYLPIEDADGSSIQTGSRVGL